MTVFQEKQQTKMVQKILITTLAATLSIGLSGCGGKSIKPESHEPTKLIKLAQNPTLLTATFSQDIGSKIDKYTARSLQVGYDANNVIVAAPNGVVTRYNTQGKKGWRVDLGVAILGGVTIDSSGSTAIISTKDAQIIALDVATGSIRWQQQMAATVLAPALVHNDRVVLSSNDGILHGLSLQTGAPIWQFVTQSPPISVRGTASPTMLEDNVAIFATADGRLHVLNIDTGIPRWSRRVGTPQGASEVERMTDIDGRPVVDDNQLYSVSYSGQLIGIDLSSSQIMFVNQAASLKALAVTPQSVVVATLEGYVNAYDRNTGALLWSNKELAYRQLTNPVTIGGYIAVGDMEGIVHLLDPSTGKILSRVKTQGALHKLQVHSGSLIALSTAGKIMIWQLK